MSPPYDQPTSTGFVSLKGLWVKPDDAESDEESDDGPEESSEEPTASEDDSGASEEAGDAAGDVGTENPDDTEEIGETEEAGGDKGRRYIEFDEPLEADLVGLQGTNTQLIDETELAIGEYCYLQLDVDGVEGALVSGDEAEVDTPGNAPLRLKERFEIRSSERTGFVADFAPVRRGQGNRYLLRPVATGTRVLYGARSTIPRTRATRVTGPTRTRLERGSTARMDPTGREDRTTPTRTD